MAMLVPKLEDPRFFQSGTALNRILREAPYLPRCSDNKTAARVRPREYAIRYPYMQINRAGFISWLIFDLDHKNAWIWQDAGLPAPNLIVSDRNSGKSHLYYAIVPVCTTAAAGAKPIAYMRAIYEAFTSALRADPDYHSGPVAKTPGHPWWKTTELHPHVYELGELADHVELVTSNPWSKGVRVEDVAHSRHCILFEKVRHYAYSIVQRERAAGGRLETFLGLVHAYADSVNAFHQYGFDVNLPASSIRATAKSVARWTWEKYTGRRRANLGVMQLSKALPLPERQKLAAEHTHSVRAQATEAKIRGACRLLKARGEAVTQVLVARAAGLARQTVATYKHLLIEATRPAAAPAPSSLIAKPTDVKYGAYQVTGVVVFDAPLDRPLSPLAVDPVKFELDG